MLGRGPGLTQCQRLFASDLDCGYSYVGSFSCLYTTPDESGSPSPQLLWYGCATPLHSESAVYDLELVTNHLVSRSHLPGVSEHDRSLVILQDTCNRAVNRRGSFASSQSYVYPNYSACFENARIQRIILARRFRLNCAQRHPFLRLLRLFSGI
ncbi:hypothetical protein BOTBODRAFT_495107 [Botryobasidium botryosum FD-172 SS1]|uniref:Uncharacterized protein n=1 Tax=Botryobasidium botryosum (strain FD-172 SS1) TaxID=930990 RepID=A0A067M6S5_BOTB1|nr:hypothetical protein BOTBODRAFT_495107 [Botryobasidium botryosum FD-172 SS1]